MNIGAILREIDAEIEKLQSIRAVLSELSPTPMLETATRKRQMRDSKLGTVALESRRPPLTEPIPSAQKRPTNSEAGLTVDTEPKVVVLAPKKSRAKRSSPTTHPVPRALSGAFPSQPVFIAKSPSVASIPVQPAAFDPTAVEAAFRRTLLDGPQEAHA